MKQKLRKDLVKIKIEVIMSILYFDLWIIIYEYDSFVENENIINCQTLITSVYRNVQKN